MRFCTQNCHCFTTWVILSLINTVHITKMVITCRTDRTKVWMYALITIMLLQKRMRHSKEGNLSHHYIKLHYKLLYILFMSFWSHNYLWFTTWLTLSLVYAVFKTKRIDTYRPDREKAEILKICSNNNNAVQKDN